ncbi:alkaline phosphatase [Chromobacterium sp. IIBBL 290-4]|uniref:alkaline phosphatase n=1 Tax=Chromobacterium sp. IIBBL 290-4 TaxID=2953890 RepID=UPI0020B77045|nr:alkaline phosphatase [Chromobacterium sp. IIBBL 290-4]UTH74556.1 alkaline phosphatase [Chromobacterium sp. IIBBL 290-4]
MQTVMKTLLAAAVLAALPAAPAQAAGEAKNVIFFLGDGMGPATVTASRIYQYGESGKLNMEKLDRTARIKTFSNDAQTTDSAPSMSAYMTGVKMNNEVISMSADTRAIEPNSDGTGNCGAGNGAPAATLLELAKAKGKAIGAVTTTRVTHATPAATYSHVCHRDAESDIIAQAVPGGVGYNAKLGAGLDVLMGGGAKFLLPKAKGGKRSDGRDLLQEFAAKGYPVLQTGAQLAAFDAKSAVKLVGIFGNDHLDYELDRVKNKTDQPSLAQMTAAAIDVLSKNGNGYVLMVEGGRIDHALHGTNAKRALVDTIAFDDAIKTALAKVDLKNTLIVVTADHDHTMTINGYSKRGNPIHDISRSYVDGQPAKDADGAVYTTLAFGNGPNRKPSRVSVNSADATADDYQQETGLRLSSETHGGGDVMLMSGGAGNQGFKGTMDNTKVFGLVKSALGL